MSEEKLVCLDVQNGLSGNNLGNYENSLTCLVEHKQNNPASINIINKQVFVSSWSKKQRRCYHRLLSGCKYAVADDLTLFFMTLTSKFKVLCKSDELQLNKDFQVIRKRILKYSGVLISYCKVRTNEGNGVLHIVFSGHSNFFIPYHWLKINWEEIHGAWNVDIKFVRGDSKGISRYFVNQYIAGQSSFVRMSRSLDWLPVGAVGVWKNILSSYCYTMGFVYCISLWDSWLMNTIVPNDRRHIVKRNKIYKKCSPYVSRSSRFVIRRHIVKNFCDEEYFKGVFAFSNRMWFLGC